MSNQVELPRLDGADASPDHDKKDAIARQHAPMDRKNLGQATFFERVSVGTQLLLASGALKSRATLTSSLLPFGSGRFRG